MVKIKRKVALGTKAFLMHLLKKEETEVELNGYTFDYNEEHYSFDPEITANEVVKYNPNNNTYTIEVEEEITEDTKIDNLVEIVINDKNIPHTAVFYNTSINERLPITIYRPQVFYMLNDDSTITRIWENGKLVD
ncbi:hypothetical protein I3V70_05155 [Staphylococcus schleiferi]|nr:hypothetical protein [Staphylococcus schleiferi]